MRLLEKNWKTIQEEFWRVYRSKRFVPNEVQHFVKGTAWTEFGLSRMGTLNRKNCELAPVTCKLVGSIPEHLSSWKGYPLQGEAEFLVLEPGTHLERHCGTTNRRLTMHLGLVTPEGPVLKLDHGELGKRDILWKEGEAFLFDDSFEHEVWHNGTEMRGVLYVSVWHPGLWHELKVPQGLHQPTYVKNIHEAEL